MDIQHIPTSIAGAITIALVSIASLATEAWKAIDLAQVAGLPTPQEANQWPFYGVLLVIICVLGLAILWVVRWVIQQGIGVIRENSQALVANADSNIELKKSLEKQSAYFDTIAIAALRDKLDIKNPRIPQTRHQDEG